ncbi:hypothetical protein [Nitratifractor sp.]
MPEIEIEKAAREAALAAPGKEVFSFDFEEKRYWIKRARPTGSNLLQHAAWRATKLPLLVPVLRQSASEALRHESSKLRRLADRGIRVPSVVLLTQEYFVMEDNGISLRKILREGREDEFSRRLYRELFETLGRLHSIGEYHGGSQLRNFNYREGEIAFLDFEEKFPESIPLKTLQFRDLFLLLFSLVKDRHPLDYSEVIGHYVRSSGNDWVVEELKKLTEKTPLLEALVRFPPIWKILDKDSKATYRMIQEIRKI